MHARFLALLVVVPAALAGCVDEAPPTTFHATASKALFSLGWAHGGAVAPIDAEIAIDVDAATNLGRVEATLRLPGGTWTVLWTNFSEAPGREFQSGGIAADLLEHGDTKAGDALLPTLHAVSAAWGRAEVRVDGVPYLDPVGGGAWSAHYMATDTGVRAADGTIKTKSGGVYDPAKPADGANEPGDRELWLVLRSVGEAEPDYELNVTEPASSPQYEKEFPFTVAAPGGPIAVTFATRGPATPVPLPAAPYDLTYTLRDANGTEVAAAKNSGTLEAPGLPGEYKVVVTGAALQSEYDLAIRVDYPSTEPYVFLFEDPSW